MKKILASLLLISVLLPQSVFAVVLNQKMGIQPLYSMFGTANSVSGTTFAVDAAWNMYASGKAAIYKFETPVQQTNGNLTCYIYATAKTGSPTNTEAVLYNSIFGAGLDPQRAYPIAVATSSNLDLSGTTFPSWVSYTWTNVTLSTSTYFIAVTNTTGTPGSNFVTYMTRPQNFLVGTRMYGGTSADGMTTDPVIVGSAEGPMVCKFNDNTLMGNPYTTTTAATSSTQYRGMRFQYDTDVEVAGISNTAFTSSGTTFKWFIYQGSTLLTSFTPDEYQRQNSSVMYFQDGAITFRAGTAYDVVATTSSNSTVGARVDQGVGDNDDVRNAMFSQMGYVFGTTPGSFTYMPGHFTGVTIIPNNIPATSGGGGGGSVQVPAIWGF